MFHGLCRNRFEFHSRMKTKDLLATQQYVQNALQVLNPRGKKEFSSKAVILKS